MERRTVKSQVISGLWLTAKIILVIVTAAFLVGGLHLLLSPDKTNANASAGRHPFVVGTLLLIIATAILVSTINRWVKILPGILGYSIVGGVLAIATGHLSNSPVEIPRLDAIVLTVFLIVATVLSLTFVGRSLGVFDRLSLMIFVFCMATAAVTDPPGLFIALSVGFSFLFLAWAINSIQRRDGHSAGRLRR